MSIAMGFNKGLERQDQTSQITKLLAALPGMREQQTLFPTNLSQTGGAPAPGQGISPSGGVDIGTPAAPAVVEQVPEAFDLKKVMSSISDPALAMHLLPTMMNYSSDTQRMQTAEKIAAQKEAYEQAKLDNKPVKITAWKQRGGKYEPVTLTVRQAQVPDVEARLQEKGYYVGETPKEVSQGPETWSVKRDPNGRFIQVSSRGKVDDYPGQGGAGGDKELTARDKQVKLLKEANIADLRPYQQQSTDAFSMTPPDDAYQALKKAADDKSNPHQKKAIARLNRINKRLQQIQQLGDQGSTGVAAGNLTKNADGTYTFTE